MPENNFFKINDSNSCGVNGFVPVSKIPNERRNIKNIKEKAYPVAWAECGNYVLLDEGQDGAVFFWDHEILDEPFRLAANFESFLEILEPFDVNEIQLAPEQVEEVWISPEFLKKLRNS